ncbi:4-(cytidine 5'-diphospho)-2-C-methyl-D-erythritol kinase [Alcaligenaceae bacterium]|nr:4-(cytidine 5'-diphospho)-2-C-methyl-D-erythritol kinase [Alcaligenaceae bacterium]
MVLYDVPAPAKINLFLHVIGRRGDGYHLLQTAFRFIDLCDSLDFETRNDGLIVREGEHLAGLAEQDDLVVRAALALQKSTGVTQGAQIRYKKNIPSGGGLGGGSSDAASTLIALNRLWGTGLTRSELMQLGLSLGADVPVFVYGQPAFAEGVGEVLTPLSLSERAYLVVQPAQSVSTAGVFSSPDLTRDSPSVTMSVFTDWQTINAADKGLESIPLFGRNDLESVVFAKYPCVSEVAVWLERQGYNARMTGSGACFFVEFSTLEQAAVHQQQIICKMLDRESENAATVQKTWACSGLFDHPLRHWISS